MVIVQKLPAQMRVSQEQLAGSLRQWVWALALVSPEVKVCFRKFSIIFFAEIFRMHLQVFTAVIIPNRVTTRHSKTTRHNTVTRHSAIIRRSKIIRERNTRPAFTPQTIIIRIHKRVSPTLLTTIIRITMDRIMAMAVALTHVNHTKILVFSLYF